MIKDNFFSYYWYLDEKEQEVTSIRIYGLNEKNENVCLRIEDFLPYIYIELPTNFPWTPTRAQMVGNKIDQIIPKNKPITKTFCMKYRLYGVQLDEKGERKKFPYLKCTFSHRDDIRKLGYALKKPIPISGMGNLHLKMHEQDADPILQFVCNKDIPTAGWFTFKGDLVGESEKITICDKEYLVKTRNIVKYDKTIVAKPKIMGFDIEVNSTNPFAMPKPEKPGDKVFQISCVFAREGCSEKDYDIYILTLGEPDHSIVGDDVTIYMYDTEYELLEGFTELVREENPNVIVGYNILAFDINYMIERAKREFCGSFYKLGFHKYNNAKEKTIKWSSSAYKNQEFQFLDAEGRIFVDLLPLIRRDYKFNNYQLKTVSMEILKDTKDDLSHTGIFKCYRIGTKKEADGTYSKKAKRAMGVCAKYCIKDSILVVKLMEKMQTWVGLTEQASTYNTSIFSIYTQGQQIKVYSQVYKYCLYNDIVVEKDGYKTKEDERYVGAHVFPPIPGLYERVLPFDFCFSGDTLVTMSNGLSKRIDSLVNDQLVFGFNKDIQGYDNYSSVHGLQKKGIRDTVKIYFQDGSNIVATPEHKFMLENGEWCEAKDLKNQYVKAGIKFPEDKICEFEKYWSLSVDGYNFSMKDNLEREKSLAFARMVGYILSDGSIYESTCQRGYTRKSCEAGFGTLFDALAFKRDISLFSDVDVTIRKRDGDGDEERSKKGVTQNITLPANISRMIHSLEDIVVGKRSTQKMKLPKFVLKEDCPKSIIREFLSGLFGGDGLTLGLNKDDTLSNIGFKWTTVEKFIEPMKEVFSNIQIMLNKFNIKSNINKPLRIKYDNANIKPKDHKENPRYDIQLTILIDSTYNFIDNIGFKYCINKSSKSYFGAMYLKMKENTRKQRIEILDRSNELIEININNVFSRKKGQMTFKDCLEIARKEFLNKEPALYQISLSSNYDLTYDRHERIRHPDKPRKYSLHKKKFPGPIEYFKDINALEWFTEDYLIKTDDTIIPSFRQKVIDVRFNEKVEVFDIEVEDVHNFLANGITVSNCSLYPTTIIAYNIDYSTIVFDESIPDSKCHVFTWSDHISCLHDPKVIRKNKLSAYIEDQQKKLKELREKRDKIKKDKKTKELVQEEINKIMEEMKPYREERAQIAKTISKNPMCAERHYRFLKEPKGVIPTILQNLLDARKNTRKNIKNSICKTEDCKGIAQYGLETSEKPIHCLKHKEENEIEFISSEKANDVKLLNNVLDKRQLAYKISANSMYGAMGVKKGYLPFMPGAMCLDGNTQISFTYGFTRKMKDLVNTDSLWSYNNGQIVSNGNGLKYNGKKEVIKITLIDGRTLRCTPDHKIMTTEGWIEAGKLLKKHNWNGTNFSVNNNYSKVITGLELPEDIIVEDEKNWSILDYKMDSPKNREITLAFCRVLGFILSDGSISSYKNKYDKTLLRSNVSIGTLLDAQIFVQDIKLITGKEPKITNCERVEIKGNTFSVHIPKVLIDKILLLKDIPTGKRTHHAYTVPSFLFEENCPLSVIREFLGGLFGGDGTSPSLSVGHPSFSPIQIQLTTIEKYKEDMYNTMNKIVFLIEKFDIKFWSMLPRLAREREELLPKDIEENPRWECIITTNSCNNLLFAQKIGFRYSSDKNNKLTIASSYQRYSDNVRKQHIDLISLASDMFDTDKKITVKDALVKARKEIYQNEIPLHEIASLSKSSEVNNHRSRPHSLKGYKLLQKFFPTAREYTRNTGCEHWFSEEKRGKKVYSLERTDIVSPCFYLDVVDIRYDGIDDVYDIIDVPEQSFFGNGVVVHNCTTFMGRTNIGIVASTIQEKYGGKLVYGDTDSNYISFPHLKTAQESWDYAEHVAAEVSKLFPKPIKC
jgi:DNA polymerase elongation subunit (family B)